jgi:hypothetical protein
LAHDVLIFDGEGVHPTRVAVVGCDYWGKNLVRNFGELGTAAWIVSSRAFIPMRMLSYLSVPYPGTRRLINTAAAHRRSDKRPLESIACPPTATAR